MLPIEPIKTADLGGGEVVNKAIAHVVKTAIQPIFEQVKDKLGYSNLPIKLEAFDISRILSYPCSYRPGRTKDNEANYLQNGYTRKWLAPYDNGTVPVRKENAKLSLLIRQAALILNQKLNEIKTVEPVVTGDVGKWITDYAKKHPFKSYSKRDEEGRSGYFASIVWTTYLHTQKSLKVTVSHAELIDQLSGGKYGERSEKEAERVIDNLLLRDIENMLENDECTATWADLGEELTSVTWSWDSWIANGFVTMIVSQSGAGKSTIVTQLAASYIRGDPWPDRSKYSGETGKVLWIETEAAQAINYQRAINIGLPPDCFVTPSSDPMQQPYLLDEAWRERIKQIASRPEIKVIIVDSLSGSHNLDEKGNQAGEIVRWLAQLARDTGKPVIVTHHIRKKNSLSGGIEITLDDVRGSSAQVQYARVVMALDVPDANNKDVKRLQVIKSNLGKFPQPLGLQITGKGIEFTTAPKKQQNKTALSEAGELLRYLWDSREKGQKLWVTDLQHEAKMAGVSFKSMQRAKEELGFKSKKQDNRWYWYLPSPFATYPDPEEEEREGL